MKATRKKQVAYLNALADIVRQPLDPVNRSKLVALITIELHNRDVMERIIKVGLLPLAYRAVPPQPSPPPPTPLSRSAPRRTCSLYVPFPSRP
jgi:hypothetical protein